VLSVAWSPDGHTLATGSFDGSTRLWDTGTGSELASLVGFDHGDWAVVTPEGHFDASEGGRRQLHLVLGLEPIDLEQMKSRYWVPGLLQQIMERKPSATSSPSRRPSSIPTCRPRLLRGRTLTSR